MPLLLRSSRLAAVARVASVSAMTVSRVLRNAPHVSPDTRKRVMRAARKVGYRPDPQISRLMSIVRGAKSRSLRAVIGIVREGGPDPDPPNRTYQFVTVEDIRQRADEHGYRVEEFVLDRGRGMTPARLNSILRARGIEGVVVVPHSSHAIASRLDYASLAAVTLGYGLQSPALHRASTNMTQGILNAALQLERRGYERIGLAVTHWVDARADYTYSGALLHYQEGIAAKNRIPLMYIPDNPVEGVDAFCRWVRIRKPDAIISLDAYVPQWLSQTLKLRIPDDIGFVVHDWTEGMKGCAGIYHRRPWVAAAAVDLLVTQLMRNEHGVPEVPRQVLIPASWIEGDTLRPPVPAAAGFSPGINGA